MVRGPVRLCGLAPLSSHEIEAFLCLSKLLGEPVKPLLDGENHPVLLLNVSLKEGQLGLQFADSRGIHCFSTYAALRVL